MIFADELQLEAPKVVEAAAATASIFVRTITTPPGVPWRQTRSANLDARHGSPLPITEVVYQLRRLEAWKPGAQGRFAAVYVLRRDIGERLNSTVDVDGRRLEITFTSPELRARSVSSIALVSIAGVASVALAASAVVTALERGADAEARLGQLELTSNAKLRSAEAKQQRAEEAKVLRDAPGRGAPISTVLDDIAWVSAAKAPDTNILALHWEGGLLAVESRGETPPFAIDGVMVEKSSKPIRPGVWLWGVDRRTKPEAGKR